MTLAAGTCRLSELGREIVGLGAKIIVLKLGDRGLYLRTSGRTALEGLGRARPAETSSWADQEMRSPAFQVRVAGTTGSGDAAVAGFLFGLLRGFSPAEALTAAAAVGACSVESPDAIGGVLPWEETAARIAAGWARREEALPSAGWSWDPEWSIWIGPGSF